MGMIFARNENGSHNPFEAMKIEDFLDCTSVLIQWVTSAVPLAVSIRAD
jgi:N-carbamoyl-L-amino-acid hydrolase